MINMSVAAVGHGRYSELTWLWYVVQVDVVKRVVELGVSTDNATFALFLGRATAIIQYALMLAAPSHTCAQR